MSSEPTIYEWAGGASALGQLTEVFYDRVVTDDVLGPVFAQMGPAHRKHVAMWLGEVFGGPTGSPPPAAPVPRWGWGEAPPYQP